MQLVQCVLVAALLCAHGALGAGLTVQDLVTIDQIGGPVPSPDGRHFVFTRGFGSGDGKYRDCMDLWLSDFVTEKKLTTAAAGIKDNSPLWLSNSTVAFLSARSGSSQIWTVDVDTLEIAQLSDYPIDVESFKYVDSAESPYFVFSSSVFPSMSLEQTAEQNARNAADPSSGQVFDSLFVRHWDHFFNGRYNHLFVAAAAVKPGDRLGPARDLLAGLALDSPVGPFGGAEDYTVSPDGQEIAFAGRNATHDQAWSTDINVYTVNVASGAIECATCENFAQDNGAAYSPDGQYIAYLAMEVPGFEADRQRVVLLNRQTGDRRVLTEAWDRSVGSLQWAGDSETLIVTAGDIARTKIFSLDVATGVPTELVGEGTNGAVSIVGDRLLFSRSSMESPASVFVADLSGANARAVVDFNRADIEMSEVEEFWYVGDSADEVHGWILKPIGYQEGKKYPMAYLIHGGPQGTWGDSFSYRWNPQVYAAAGYVTVMVDPHGSTGYGQVFTDAVSKRWGAGAYNDVMLGLDYVQNTYDFIDANRTCALGASFGGYMVAWLNGHTDRFNCFVMHDGVFDTRMLYYTTDELWSMEHEFGGSPYKDKKTARLYGEWSPSEYVHNWNTPMLVVQGGRDYRIVDGQGFGAFTALQRRGIDSRLLYFPDENHWVLKPDNSIKWHNEVLSWLARHTS